jgi:hypothetical protein
MYRDGVMLKHEEKSSQNRGRERYQHAKAE